jgi:para-nitrobenzyl esterase
MNKEKSQALGKTVLENLGITAENLNQLDTISYQRLVKAGNDAILSISGPRQPGAKTMFGFAPSADGETLLQQPFSPGFADISNDIPLLMGTTLNELINTAYGEKDLTLEQAKERLTKTYGNKTNQFVELYEKAYPNFTPQDLLSIDTVFRPFTIRTLDARAAQSNAPLYAYFLAWKSGVDDASKGSFHGLDIPLAFNTVDLRPDWTGDTPEAWELAETMSSAWLNFAKTGNPNVPERLPEWPIYTAETGATMYFDDESKVLNNHDRELMELVSSVD